MADQKKSGSKAMGALVILNTIAMLSLVGVVVHYHLQESKKEKLEDIVRGQAARDPASIPAAAAIKKVRHYELDTFTANLANPRAPKYVRARIEFELDEQVQEKELDRNKAEIRDKILTILNGKRDAEILTTEGKNYLKQEIKDAVNNSLETGEVKMVLLTDFLVN